jgi:hypothetical protein
MPVYDFGNPMHPVLCYWAAMSGRVMVLIWKVGCWYVTWIYFGSVDICYFMRYPLLQGLGGILSGQIVLRAIEWELVLDKSNCCRRWILCSPLSHFRQPDRPGQAALTIQEQSRLLGLELSSFSSCQQLRSSSQFQRR